jgi:hypothetical protein
MNKLKFSEFLNESETGFIMYHVSPVKFTPGDKFGQGYDELFNTVNEYDCDDGDRDCLKKYDILVNTLKSYEKGMGNVSGKNDNQIYVTSQPQAWMDVQSDELGITYEFGGIYLLKLRRPVKESMVPAGMGYTLPEAIINVSDILSFSGPYKSESAATARNNE